MKRFITRSLSFCSIFAVIGLMVTARPVFADEMKVPTTMADHEAMAKRYREEAVEYRKVAEEHRQMAAAYAKVHPDAKGGAKNPMNEKMQKHCMQLVRDADKLAADAEKAADYHTFRGKELQGK